MLRDLNRNRDGRYQPLASMVITVLACAAVTFCDSLAIQDKAEYVPGVRRPLGFSLVNTMTGSGLRTIVLLGRSAVTAVFGPHVNIFNRRSR